jgi:hypothetical protein
MLATDPIGRAGHRVLVAGHPETVDVADGQYWCPCATLFEIAQQLGPGLRGLPIAVADGDQFLAAIGAQAEEHQTTQPLVLQTNVEMHPVGPQIHVIDLAQIALLERCQLLAPLAREPLDRRRAQASFAAEQLSQRGLEVLGRDTAQIQHRQHFGDFR